MQTRPEPAQPRTVGAEQDLSCQALEQRAGRLSSCVPNAGVQVAEKRKFALPECIGVGSRSRRSQSQGVGVEWELRGSGSGVALPRQPHFWHFVIAECLTLQS